MKDSPNFFAENAHLPPNTFSDGTSFKPFYKRIPNVRFNTACRYCMTEIQGEPGGFWIGDGFTGTQLKSKMCCLSCFADGKIQREIPAIVELLENGQFADGPAKAVNS